MVSRAILNLRNPSLVTPGMFSSQLVLSVPSRLEVAEGVNASNWSVE